MKRKIKIGSKVKVLWGDRYFFKVGDVGVVVALRARGWCIDDKGIMQHEPTMMIDFGGRKGQNVCGDGRWWALIRNAKVLKY